MLIIYVFTYLSSLMQVCTLLHGLHEIITHLSLVFQLLAYCQQSWMPFACIWVTWMIHCRYYVKKEGQCIMRMVNAEFEYTYEYQGNAPKLVHTPLTDKCYLTLTQGLSRADVLPSYCLCNCSFIGPIPWGHSGPLCHALSLSLSSSSSLALS